MKRLDKHVYRLKRLFGMEELKLLIDVAHCNLRCFMCPRGGVMGLKNDRKGLMSIELFRRIIDKFRDERVPIRDIEVGNWGEPLLNRELPQMIRYAKNTWPPSFMSRPGSIGISTNLNVLADPDGLLASGVDRIRVSISGMTQGVYEKNHIGGDIERVLQNMLRLADSRRRLGLKVVLGVGFHDLLYNKQDAGTARRFCADNGLDFTLMPMYLSSVEENIRFHKEKERFRDAYSRFIDVDKEVGAMKTASGPERCQFRRSVITVSFDGQACRCCGVFEDRHYMGSFFDHKVRDIPRIGSPICGVCVKTPMSWR